MKIGFLSFYSGEIDRGVEVATNALAEGLSKYYQVTLFQAGNRKNSKIHTIQIPVHTQWTKETTSSFWRNVYADYFSLKILLFTLKSLVYIFRERYDIIVPTNGGWQVLLIRLVCWILHSKLVIQGNSGIGRDDFWQLLCLPDHFVAISSQGLEWSQKKAPWIKKSYIPYGVNLNEFKLTLAKKIDLNKPIVLCVSAFIPYKQINLLIQAMELVKDASLLIIGHGPDEIKLRNLANKLISGRFQMLTNVRHDDLIGYYKAAHVFSLPSAKSEAFGIVYIEAMAAGLTLVAPDDLNRRKILGDAAIYIDPHDITEYAKGIKKALSNPKSAESVKQANFFSWDSIVVQYRELFESLK